MYRSLRVPLLAVVAGVCAALPTPALAGTYTVSQSTPADIAGWALSGSDPGITGCSYQINSGVCARIQQPRPLVLVGSGATKAGSAGLWTWTAPPTTSVVSGSVSVSYATLATHTTVYLKTRTAGQTFESQPRKFESRGSGAAQWSVAKGAQAIGIAFTTAGAVTYGSGLGNLIRINHLDLMLSDTTAPTVSAQGTLTNQGWLTGISPVCLTASAADAGAGVARIDLEDAAGHVLDSYIAAGSSAIHPGALQVDHQLCVTPANLAEGIQTLHVVAVDAAGESAESAVQVKVDTVAPKATATQPSGSIVDRRPAVSVRLDGGPSGIAAATGDLDGQPLTLSAGVLSLTPGTDLALGTHTVRWTATDGAGNTASDQFSFMVVADLPTSLSLTGPFVLVHGRSGALKGTLRGSSAAVIANQRIDVQRRILPNGAWQSVGSFTTNTLGIGRFTVHPGATSSYRITDHAFPSLTRTMEVKVRQKLRLASSGRILQLGRSVALRPRLLAGVGHFRVNVQIYRGGGWKTIGSPRVGTSLAVRPLARGTYRFRATGGGSAITPTITSDVITVTVR